MTGAISQVRSVVAKLWPTLGLLLCVASGVRAQADRPGLIEGQVFVGYRFVDVEGAEPKYKEDIGLDEGPVLFGLNMRIVTEAQMKAVADEFTIDLNDIGSQPFETFRIGARKNGRYEFKYDRREADYFYDNLLSSDEGMPVIDLRRYDFRRTRDLATLDLSLTKRANLKFGLDSIRRSGENTGTPRLRRDIFVTDGKVDDSLDTFWGNFAYSWDKITLMFEGRRKDFDNPVSFSVPGRQEGPSETLDFLIYDTPYTYEADEYIVRVVARPTQRLDIRFSAEFQDMNLETDLVEQWEGTDSSGNLVSADISGDGTVQRDLGLLDLDLTYLITDRVGIVGGIRAYELDQDGRSMFGATLSASKWNMETTAIDLGAQYLATRAVTVTGGILIESRDVKWMWTADGSGPDRDRSTDNLGFFVDAAWNPSKRVDVNVELDLNSIDEPFTVASPSDRTRLRVRGRYRWDNGCWASGSYAFNDFENNESGWQADNSRGVVRVGFRNDIIEASGGYSVIEMESSIDQVLNGTNPRAIRYLADSDFVDAFVRWFATQKLALVGSVYLYDNTGTFGVERQDYRGAIEYVFLEKYVVGLAYRTINFEEDNFGFNDYDADVIDLSVGYRW